MRSDIRSLLDELVEAAEGFPWNDKEAYAAFMAQVFYYTRHTTRVLALAASRFSFVDEAVHQRFIRHCAEEMKHEVLADKDVAALGFQVGDFPEFASTRAFYQCHYHTIDHFGPWTIFGYILSLEGLAAGKGPWIYEQIKNSHGESAARFMKVHANEDVAHIEEAQRQLESMPPEHWVSVIAHMKTSCALYAAIMDESLKWAERSRRKVA